MTNNFKNISLYTFSSLLAKFFSLLAIPIIARNLTIKEYGEFTILISVVVLIQSIFLFGFEHSLNYYFNKFRSSIGKKILVSTQLLFILLTYFLTFVPISLLLSGKVEYVNLILFWGFIAVLIAYFGTLLRVDMLVSIFIKSQILQSVVLLVAVYLFVVVYQLSLQGALYANIFSMTMSVMYIFFSIKKYLIFNFNIKLFKKVLHYGLPLMPAGIMLWASMQLDRYYILFFLDEYLLGIYGFSLSIAMIPLLLKAAFKNAIDPFIMKAFHREALKTKKYISSYFTLSLFIFGFLFLFLSIFAHEIVLLVGGLKYLESIPYIPWLLLIASITTLNQYFVYGLNFTKTNKLILRGLIYMLIINVILAYVLIGIFNIYGVILANLIANISYTIYLYKKSNELYPIEHNFSMNVTIVISVLGGGILNYFYFQEAYIMKTLCLLIFFILNIKVYKVFRGLLYE
jgi:O-antigen/teichoic acid export membrane protein